MREGVAICVLFLFLANGLMVSGYGGADGARSGEHGRDASRATTLIYNVYDLQNMSLDLSGSYELANDIDASATVDWNNGEGFVPVGNWSNEFKGSLDGNNHTISGLFINSPGTSDVGLFGFISWAGSVKNLGLIDGNVTGKYDVGGLAGTCDGKVNNSYYTGNVTGDVSVGGLVGYIDYTDPASTSMMDNSHAAANVTGNGAIGGLAGCRGNSIVKNSYFTGSVNGTSVVGGLFGDNGFVYLGSDGFGAISNTHYNIDDVMINGGHHVTLGGLFDAQYRDWFSNGLTLDISDYGNSLVPSGGCYDINDVQGLRDLLGFAEIAGYRFCLASDIDLSNDSGFYIPYLSAVFDGDNHTISNLDLNLSFVSYLGMFGINNAGTVINTGILNGRIEGYVYAAGLVGWNNGAVNNSYATVKVIGYTSVGGLVGWNFRTVNNSVAAGDVTGSNQEVGGLVGSNYGAVANSHATGNVNGTSSTGGLVGVSSILGFRREAFEGYAIFNSYATGNVNGTFSVGGLEGFSMARQVAGSHATGNVNGTGDRIGGLVGGLDDSLVSNSYATGNVIGSGGVGGLLGNCDNTYSGCMVSNSYATGNVTGDHDVGGLVGSTRAYRPRSGGVNNTYATGDVSGVHDVGGLVGYGNYWSLSNSYSVGKVNGTGNHTGGLAGCAENGTVSNCFWDNGTSGQMTSDGGTGKTTAEMKTQSTFTDAGWDFDNVWFMIENVTYPVFKLQYSAFPVANAGVDQTVDEGTVVTFNGGGSSDIFGIANYTWSFIDGVPRTIYGVAPAYKFDDPGIFNVTLRVTNVLGSWDIDTTTITVNDITPPVSDAGPDQIVDQGALVTFNGSGSSDNVGIVNYTWTFSDGTGDIGLYGAGPSHIFDVPGVYAVRLNVSDARGYRATDMMNITVKDMTPPAADAGPDLVVDQGTLVTFDGSASTDNIGIVNYSWKFIEGGPVTLYGVRPAYRFDHPGKFLVTLIATDAASNQGTDIMTVTVNDTMAPVADAGPDLVTDEGSIVYLDGTGSFDNIGVVNYTWTFMDGVPVTLYDARPTYIFDTPGIFTVSLNVTDAAGNWNIDTMTVTVKDITAPIADAGPDRTVDQGIVVTFNGSGSSDNVGIVNYTWTFYCGTQRIVLYGVSPSFTFSVPGVYHVQLNVSDEAGFRAVDAMTLTVKDITPPVANAGSDQRVVEGSTVVFDGSRSMDNCGIEKYFWNFTYNGKAQSLEGKKVSFKFDKAGVYVVVLTVVDGAGNRGEDRVVITVEPRVNVLQGLLWMPVLLIAIVVVGLAGYIVMRKRKTRKGGPMQENGSLP